MSFRVLLLLAGCWNLAGFSRAAAGAERPSPEAPAPVSLFDVANSTANSPGSRVGGFGCISKNVLESLLSRELKFNETVAEPILNMTTQGLARVNCRIGLELVPNPQTANLRLLMNGTAMMPNAVSTLRSVQIVSSSQTRISGHQDIFVDASGFRAASAQVSGSTLIQVQGVDARWRFVERLASRRIGRMQPQAEQVAGQLAGRRAARHFESEVARPVGDVQHEYIEHVVRPLSEQGAFPDARLATTSDHLIVRLLRRPASSQRQSELPPLQLVGSSDLGVCLNDALVNELIAPLMGGRTLTDRQFADFMQTITGETPRPLWAHARAEPWSVTVAKERPLVVSFADDAIEITLRIDRVTQGAQNLNRTFEVSASYALEITPDGPHLIRSGNLLVKPLCADAPETPDTREAQFEKFLERKFSGVFLRDIYFDGLMPPQGGTWAKLRHLQLKQLRSRDGWLVIAYELPSARLAGDRTPAPVR